MEKKTKKEIKYLQINEDYRVSADDAGYIIQKRNGKGNWGIMGYHSTIESVFGSLCEHHIRDNIDDLKLAADMIKDLREKIKELTGIKI
jgi:hypothetical protein